MSRWPSFAGMRCLVTGGSSGIGRSIVVLLHDNGARIVTCARDAKRLNQVARELADDGQRLVVVPADVTTTNGLDAVFEAVSHMGGLDILITNAAIAGGSVFDSSDEAVDEILKINLFGQVACVRRGLEQMEENGHILLVGSMSADVREEEGSVYVASKAGLQGFAGAFRKEASKRGIHVHLLEPGAVATPLHGLSDQELANKRARSEMLIADEVAECVAFILTRPAECDIVSLQVRPHKQFI